MVGIFLCFWCVAFFVFNASRFTTSDRGANVMVAAYAAMVVSGAFATLFAFFWLMRAV